MKFNLEGEQRCGDECIECGYGSGKDIARGRGRGKATRQRFTIDYKVKVLKEADLGITKTHSRPHVSNDNPYSECQFKTLKYRPAFPARFGSMIYARTLSSELLSLIRLAAIVMWLKWI